MTDPALCEYHLAVVAVCILLAHVDDETAYRIATDLACDCPECLNLKENR